VAASVTLAESLLQRHLGRRDWMQAPVGEYVVWHLNIPGQTTDLMDDDGRLHSIEELVSQARC